MRDPTPPALRADELAASLLREADDEVRASPKATGDSVRDSESYPRLKDAGSGGGADVKVYDRSKKKKNGKGKAKGKGNENGEGKSKSNGKKGNRPNRTLPAALIGGEAQNANGEGFCYGFNLGTCTEVKPGDKCDKGWRKCMTNICKEHHASTNCK